MINSQENNIRWASELTMTLKAAGITPMLLFVFIDL
jgi:hypothetical protein